MNPIQVPIPDDQNVVEFAESPGRRLRVQRQSKGLEIVRIAAQLHLRPSMVEALEHDQYEKLPNPVFVAGYLRNYARLLGLDPEPILTAYRAGNPDMEQPAPRVARPAKSEIGSSHILVRLISLALIAGVIGMLALWWQNRAELLSIPSAGDQAPGLTLDEDTVGTSDLPGDTSDSGLSAIEESRAEVPAVALPERPTALADTQEPAYPPVATEPSADESLTPSMGAGVRAPLAMDAAVTDGATDSAPVPGREPVDVASVGAPETASESAPQTPVNGEVALEFSGPCWIDVRDASGAVVLTGEMAKGDRRVLEGQPPYSFVIGNAGATSLTVGGEPFDLQGRSRGNVARFKLNPEAPE